MAIVVPNQVFAEISLGGRPLKVVGYLPWHEGRSRVERFIAARFRKVHGALVHSFLPTLISLEAAGGEILAAIGVRSAQTEKLFLEHYLNQSIELEISHLSRMPCVRRDVIEVGNLAGGQRGISRCFFAVLAAVLQEWGARWLACTGTAGVANVFHRLGIQPFEIMLAQPERLPGGGAEWGRYYEHQPTVMVGEIPDGLRRVAQTGLLQRCHFKTVEVRDVLIA
ncbi:MAG: thermostable hemolysin [Pseudomonadota bacterium]|nr:thermostable hemolysin [Pseudomonadota bacterium]